MVKNNLKIAALMGAVFALSACSGGSGSSSSGGSTPTTTGAAITIDNAGTIPNISGASTTTVIYVHNNSNVAVNNITYDSQNNSGSEIPFIDPTSAASCASINAGQACPLTVNTPILPTGTAQGSTSISASYIASDGTAAQYNQVVSYANVLSNAEQGAVINSGASIFGAGNSVGYATVYLYGSGTGQIYDINSLSINNPGITITQGDITGRELASGQVQAIEISAQTPVQSSSAMAAQQASAISGTMLATSTDSSSGKTFTSTASTLVPAAANGAILTSGSIPLINTADSGSNLSGQMFVVNSGNAPATSISITPSTSDITIVSSGTNACGTTLAAGAQCTITFTVTPAGGSGNIIVSYTGNNGTAAVAQTVTWYNGAGGPLLQMTATDVTFNATQSAVSTVTVKNVGGFALTDMRAVPLPSAVTGGATGVPTPVSCLAPDGVTSTGTTLSLNGTCSYGVTVTDTATERGIMQMGISGDYVSSGVQTYSRVTTMNYDSLAYAASLTITPPESMVIVGNGTSTESQVITVNSVGNAPAVIEASTLSLNPTMSIVANGCLGDTLESSGGVHTTCAVVVVLGPESSSVQVSGTSIYTVAYHGGQTPPDTTVSASIPWTVQSDQQSLTMVSVAAINKTTGNGESRASQFIFDGAASSNPSAQKVVLTYQNSGTNPITFTGINNTNSSVYWVIGSDSTCVVGNSVAVNGLCTIVFNNQLYLNSIAISGLGSVQTEDITVPSFVFTDNTVPNAQFEITPPLPSGGSTVFATAHQATITNSAVQSGSNVTVSSVLTNGTNYSTIQVTAKMEDYLGGSTSSQGCTFLTESGNMGQECTLLSPGLVSAFATYPVMPVYIGNTLNVLFQLFPNNQTVAMSPLATSLVLH